MLLNVQNLLLFFSFQTSVGVQCPSAPVSRAPSIRSPLYSEAADEQEALSFGGLNASDSGFGSSNNVLHAEETELLQVIKMIL